jgi:hypothetical protein
VIIFLIASQLIVFYHRLIPKSKMVVRNTTHEAMPHCGQMKINISEAEMFKSWTWWSLKLTLWPGILMNVARRGWSMAEPSTEFDKLLQAILCTCNSILEMTLYKTIRGRGFMSGQWDKTLNLFSGSHFMLSFSFLADWIRWIWVLHLEYLGWHRPCRLFGLRYKNSPRHTNAGYLNTFSQSSVRMLWQDAVRQKSQDGFTHAVPSRRDPVSSELAPMKTIHSKASQTCVGPHNNFKVMLWTFTIFGFWIKTPVLNRFYISKHYKYYSYIDFICCEKTQISFVRLLLTIAVCWAHANNKVLLLNFYNYIYYIIIIQIRTRMHRSATQSTSASDLNYSLEFIICEDYIVR